MSKDKDKNQNVEATASTETVETAAVVEVAKKGRQKSLTLADGSVVTRKDYVLRRWGEKASRAEITAEVNALLTAAGEKNIPYQIVFQYTSGVAGGPDPKPKAVAPTVEAAPEA